MSSDPQGVNAIEMHGVTAGSMKDPAVVAVAGVDWTVRAGEFWVVAGSQRSGKTDFLMMTGGLIAPASGSYTFFGQEMPIFDDDRLAERLKVGVVFDGGQLFNGMSIRDNIALPLRYHDGLSPEEIQARLEQLLAETHLTKVADSRPMAVGRGQQKYAGLARALALRPEVLLLDNPMSGAGPRHAAWWLRFFEELSQGHRLMDGKPVTIVVTVDDLRPWRGGRQQFACIHQGRFQVIGGWADVERCPDNAVQDLLHDRVGGKEPEPEPDDINVTATE